MCFLGHLPVPRESVTHRALFRRRWRAKPPPYPEMTTNAKWVHGHWTIQVDFHRSMASFLMACKTTADTPINVNPVNVRTKDDYNIRPTEKQHTTNRAMTGARAHTCDTHIDWLGLLQPCRIPMYSYAIHAYHWSSAHCSTSMPILLLLLLYELFSHELINSSLQCSSLCGSSPEPKGNFW